MDYGYNVRGSTQEGDPAPLGLGGTYAASPSGALSGPVPETAVAMPTEMMAIGDGFAGGNGIVLDGTTALWRRACRPDEDNSGSTKRSYSRHQGKANVVFCDGHTESLSLQALFVDSTDAALQRWNRDHQGHRERTMQRTGNSRAERASAVAPD